MKYLMLLFSSVAVMAQTNGVIVKELTPLPSESIVFDASVIIGPLMVAAYILKHAFPAFPNRFIPLLTWVGGITGYLIKSGDTSANGIFTAVLVAATATGIHSGIKNTFQKREPASK